MHPTELANTLLALLPQTQCTKCGYPDCRTYAQAMATEQALHNQCPPGGQEGVARLAQVLQRPIIALNAENGVERPRAVAVIDEARCIGCTLCIQACPVDAIVGAPKQMHTVIASDCTGCDLCIAPCPVDCISMLTVTGTKTGWAAWPQEKADQASAHYTRHTERLSRLQKQSHRLFKPRGSSASSPPEVTHIPTAALATSSTLNTAAKNPSNSPSESSVTPPSPTQSTHKQALLRAILERAEQKNA